MGVQFKSLKKIIGHNLIVKALVNPSMATNDQLWHEWTQQL